MRKWLGWIMTTLVCASAGAVSYVSREVSTRLPSAPVAARGPAAPTRPVANVNEIIGVVVASASIEITAHIDGRIDMLRLRLGDRVETGQVLAAFDARALKADLAMRRASAAAAKAEVERAALEKKELQVRYLRRAALAKDGLVSSEEIESAEFQVQLAAPRLAIAQATFAERDARVRRQEQELRETVLVAPFSGSVAARYVDPGAYITRGTTVLRLIRGEGTWVRFSVSDALRSRIVMNTEIEVAVDGHDDKFVATVETVAPEIDSASGLIVAEARLEVTPRERERILGSVARVKLR